jgi:hypothetical protein
MQQNLFRLMHPLAFSKDPHSVSSYRVVICTATVIQQQRRNHTDETQPGHFSNISTSSATLTRIRSSGARYHVPIHCSRSTYRYVAWHLIMRQGHPLSKDLAKGRGLIRGILASGTSGETWRMEQGRSWGKYKFIGKYCLERQGRLVGESQWLGLVGWHREV